MTKPSPKEFQAFATAVGRRYGDRVGLWSIWNEPNHPQFLKPQFVHKKAKSPRIYRKLFLAGQRGLRASGNGGDTLLFGETAPRGTPRVVAPLAFLRGALCLNRSYHRKGHCARISAGGYAHHAYTTRTGPRFRPPDKRRRHDRRAVAALPTRSTKRRPGGRDPARARHLPDRVRDPEHARPDRRRLAHQAGRVPRDRRAHGVRQPAREVVLAVPARATTSRARAPPSVRYGGFESGLRRADGKAKPSLRRVPPAARDRGLRPVRRAVGPRAPVGDADEGARSSPRAARASRSSSLRTVTTNHHGVYGLRAKHHDKQRYRVRWTAPDGKVWLGPPIHATK